MAEADIDVSARLDTGVMQRPPTADFSMLLVNAGGEPRPQRAIDPPRRGVVTAETYGGETVTLEVDVVARSGAWLCLRQSVSQDWPAWCAWVEADKVRPR